MSILNEIERLALTEGDINWDMVDEISCYHPRQLVNLVDWFLLNLSKDHQVPGQIYQQLLGIGNWAQKYNQVTAKQRRYVILAIATYWQEVSLFADI
jgi:hypothetical protein